MRILLLGPIHNEKSKRIHSFPYSQAQASWVETLENLGHKVEVFIYTDSHILPNNLKVKISDVSSKKLPKWHGRFLRYHSKFYRYSPENIIKNKKLTSTAKKFKPELVLISGGASFLFDKTIEEIKFKFKTKVVMLSGIDPKLAATPAEKTLLKNNLIDFVFGNDCSFIENWKKLGAKKAIVLPVAAVNPKIHKKVSISKEEKDELSSDVCFVGRLTRDRQKILSSLKDFNIKIWGDLLPEAPLSDELKNIYQGTAHGEKMVRIYNCTKIAINIQSTMKCGGNMRTFEIPACGALQIADKVDLDFFTDKKDIILFKNSEDLKKKIKYYLKNEKERKKIVNESYKRVQKEHIYEKRFKNLLKIINEKN